MRAGSGLYEILYAIQRDLPCAAVQMHAVGVKQPAISARDIVRVLPQHQYAKGIAVEGKKVERRKGPARRGANRLGDRLMDRDIAAACLVRDGRHDRGIFHYPPVEFALERVARIRCFSYRGK